MIGIIEPNKPNFHINGYRTIVNEEITRGAGVLILVRTDILITYINIINDWMTKIVIQITPQITIGLADLKMGTLPNITTNQEPFHHSQYKYHFLQGLNLENQVKSQLKKEETSKKLQELGANMF